MQHLQAAAFRKCDVIKCRISRSLFEGWGRSVPWLSAQEIDDFDVSGFQVHRFRGRLSGGRCASEIELGRSIKGRK